MKNILDYEMSPQNTQRTYPSRLFVAACMALTVTSMTFAIRAGIIADLGIAFKLSDTELGWIVGMAAFGFPVATTLGGFFVDQIGMKRWMWLAFGAHLLGIVLTITATGFWGLFLSTFLIGFANGSVEAVCNPLVASLFPNNKIVMLNKFHVWFPGGIVIGALLSTLMKSMGIIGVWQVAIILLPTFIYGYLFWGQNFPKTERITSGVSYGQMLRACVSPLFLLLTYCMFLTANTELSTTQWIDKLLGSAGAKPLLILALVNGLMAIGRFFGGAVIHRLNPLGVLLASAVFATLGLFLLRTTEGGMLYVAAVVFALGVCYFWPTMLGYVSENIPQSGALGLSLMGGAGMFGNWAFQTFYLGAALDYHKQEIAKLGTHSADKIELLAGQQVLATINILPLSLILLFGILFFTRKK